ncbi:MAG TPA: hypothetical protein VGM03_22820 [Phycisphaerae bacterium]|jgi:hypothetical protein
MLLQVDYQTLKQNLFLLIGLLVLATIGLILIVAVWTGIKAWRFHKRQRNGWEEYRRERLDAQGRPLPPSAAGVCDRCGCVGERVYFLPSGERRCLKCM